ncbi:TPA: helix-turn-helix transcriptional regulator [Streptococcus pneumoniae]|uniref:helix-turn-helix domain-containing protein n=1 Tax=Streptococcus pneumoniae TaxID=1313 RepID=UPI0005E11692|nr:helix-turn-helix transcriptional regulator [Streptococcus pneumoniae]CIU05425.1 phage transcriptional regulator%2C Cro/CI family [Streptococcus pneumoniae]CIU09821.1 phage transcriptional regulator%2C Cro/CI family [Streptococcus pneumoniae]COA98438.1 phage transcriptional regulator%2C Cro/CI family [Streptococcus pneumoniae]VQJ71137.1 phage transcriptional regulator, Cro/CI family [Streptococcus pneumoniae]VTD32531.1 phage transcriptional regulator, Cro/CI family [Streptococcus pneumoniae]
MFPTFEIVKELCRRQGISLNTLEERIGFSRNSLYSWKNSEPKPKKLNAVADYFNVSTDYLLGRTDNPTIASDDTIAGYTSDDLRKMAENAKTFDGKPLTEEDIDAIQNIIEIYLRGR